MLHGSLTEIYSKIYKVNMQVLKLQCNVWLIVQYHQLNSKRTLPYFKINCKELELINKHA